VNEVHFPSYTLTQRYFNMNMSGTCEFDLQCANNFGMGHHGPAVCLNNVCICNPLLGYSGDECDQPSGQTFFFRSFFIFLFCLQSFANLYTIRVLYLNRTGEKIFGWLKSHFQDNSSVTEIEAIEGILPNFAFTYRDFIAFDTLLIGITFLITLYSDIMATFWDNTFSIRKKVTGNCLFLHAILHSSMNVELGLLWFGIYLKICPNPKIEEHYTDIKFYVRVFCVCVCIFCGLGLLWWMLDHITQGIALISCFVTFFAVSLGIRLSWKLRVLQSYNHTLKNQVKRIKQTTYLSVFAYIGILLCTFISNVTFNIDGFLSGIMLWLSFPFNQAYQLTILNYVTPDRTAESRTVFVESVE